MPKTNRHNYRCIISLRCSQKQESPPVVRSWERSCRERAGSHSPEDVPNARSCQTNWTSNGETGCAVKGPGPQRGCTRPGTGSLYTVSSQSSGGGNETAEASDAEGRNAAPTPPRHTSTPQICLQARANVSKRCRPRSSSAAEPCLRATKRRITLALFAIVRVTETPSLG